MVLMRIVVVGVAAVAITVIGVMTIGLAETARFGLIGLAAAGALLGFMWLAGRSSGGTPPPAGGKSGSKPTQQGKPKG